MMTFGRNPNLSKKTDRHGIWEVWSGIRKGAAKLQCVWVCLIGFHIMADAKAVY